MFSATVEGSMTTARLVVRRAYTKKKRMRPFFSTEAANISVSTKMATFGLWSICAGANLGVPVLSLGCPWLA